MKNFPNFKLEKQRGFTLLEMIISIGIFVLVATASSVLFNQALRAYRYTTSRMAAAREAELAMQWIVRDIRPDPSGNPKPILDAGVDDSGPNEISLDMPTGSNIHYHLHPDPTIPGIFTIQRERTQDPGSPHDLLARNVVVLYFEYFDLANQPVAPTGAVATVEIIIETRVNDQTFRLYSVANR
jgi:prepilin-type N-terminal cleavage/methylation domain-containing protein